MTRAATPYTGIVGVRQTHGGRWLAQLWREGSNLGLGTYDTEAEATAARRGALAAYNAFRRGGYP